MSDVPRRRFLQTIGTALAIGAGCGDARRSTRTSTSGAVSETPLETSRPASTPTYTEPQTASPSATPDPAAEELWTAGDFSGRVKTLQLPEVGPAEEPAGPLYVTTNTGEMARIEPIEGRTRWSSTIQGEEEEAPPLLPAGDNLYAIGETYTEERLANHVEALDPTTGERRWVFGDRSFLEVLGVVKETVVLSGYYIEKSPYEIGPEESPRGDGILIGADRNTGEERWRVTVPNLHGADIASHGVYALEWYEPRTYLLTLHAFDIDGTERWSIDTGTGGPTAPLATDDLLLAGAGPDDDTRRGGVGRYDPGDGSDIWTAGNWGRGPEDLALQDDSVLAGDHPLLALDRDGSQRYQLQDLTVPEVPGTSETLYQGAKPIRAIDRSEGVVRWRYRPVKHDYVHIQTVLADHLAIDHGIGHNYEVVLLDEAEGNVAGTFETPDHYLGMAGAGHRLLIGVGNDVMAYEVFP